MIKKSFENAVKGWFLTFIGLVICICAVLYWTNLVQFPASNFAPKPIELLIAFAFGLYLIRMPPTKVDSVLSGFINKLTNGKNSNTDNPTDDGVQ